MKKTIIALLALAGVAAAAPTVVWDMDFEKTGVTLNCATGVTTSLQSGVGTSLISNGAITLTNDRFGFNQTGGQVSYAEEFTLVAKVSLAAPTASNSAVPVIFSLGEDDRWFWNISYDETANVFALNKNGWDSASTDNKSSGNISYTAGEIITLALQNDGKGKVSLYVDGELAGYSTISRTVDYGSDKYVKRFAFSGPISGDAKASSTIYDVQLVKGLTTSIVPEPTTATLSLLALAGLAARRRRK